MDSNTAIETRRERNTSVSSESGGGLSVQRIILFGAAVGLAAFALKQMPDLRRYLKLRSM
jgi:hypothetical protein